MKQFLIAVILATSGFVAMVASAQDEALPEAVSEAYLAYETAMEARDYNAAVEAAETAWREAERARIDRDLIGVLAANYGQLAQALGRHDAAYEAWRESAEIADRVDNSAGERAQRWYQASLSALALGDIYDARSCAARSRRAIRASDGNLPDDLVGDSYYMLARTSLQLGRFGLMGEAASEAIAAFERSGRAYDVSFADAYYLAGVDAFFWGERDESIPYFNMARGIFRQLGDGYERDAASSGYWMLLADDDLTEGEISRAEAVIAASPFPRLESDEEDTDTERPAGFEDTSPSLRAQPRYPDDAARAGVEGIVMVGFTVTADGRTTDIEILGSAPAVIFDEVAVEAVRSWHYEPARQDGEAVVREGVMTQFNFILCEPGFFGRCRQERADDEATGD
jgi:TonB family protein